MKRIAFFVAALVFVAFIVNTAWAPPPENRSGRRGFNFGGTTEFDSPPQGKNDWEKRALAVLDEMSKGKWYGCGYSSTTLGSGFQAPGG
jgi:hypothetical protein